MLFFLTEEDGSVSEHYYEGKVGFVREIVLTNRSTGFEMTGRIYFEENHMEFIDNDTWKEYEVVAMIPEGF